MKTLPGAALAILLLGATATLGAQQPLSIGGTVRNSAGAPVAGAGVQLGERSTTANDQGVYQLDSVRAGRQVVAIRAVGYQPLRSTIVVSAGSRFDFVLERATSTLPTIIVEAKRSGIYGTVADSTLRPLAGAQVEVIGPGGGEARSDSAGRFAFPKAHNGQFAVRFTADGFGERRVWVNLKKDEGRELSVRLVPARTVAIRVEKEAFAQLRERLDVNLPRERMNAEELQRYGSLGLCDVNPIVQQLTPDRSDPRFRMANATVLLVLNGTDVRESFPLYAICAWRADEVELVEFGSSVCRDATRTIADLVNAWCSGIPPSARRRNVRTSMIPGGGTISTQRDATVPFVVIWEKR